MARNLEQILDSMYKIHSADYEAFGKLIQEAYYSSNRPEICICAAVIDIDGRVIRGHRHSDCIKRIVGNNSRPMPEPSAQGFITSRNRYVTREEGRILQDKAGIDSASLDGYMGDTLFSEDLY